MARFITEDKLNDELVSIFKFAKKELIIVSPYIRLHARIKSELDEKRSDPNVKISILYGKNESNRKESLTKKDFEYFKDFPNIEISYEPRLHAKFYANDKAVLLTSMNLIDGSQNANIEFGIITHVDRWDSFTNRFDESALKYFKNLIKKSATVFCSKPIFEKNNLGFKTKKFKSKMILDELSTVYEVKNVNVAFCIRTGLRIPFNLKKPYSAKAYSKWASVDKKNFKCAEKYCHFSGDESNGETSFSKPILTKHYRKAQVLHKFVSESRPKKLQMSEQEV